MDIRLKTFVAEASTRMNFLRDELGCIGPEAHHPSDSYPLVISVQYRRRDLAVEVFLLLAYAGEEYVATRLSLGGGSNPREQEVGSHTAHTAYAMRRALDRQAEALRDALRDV
ncbi:MULTISPECIES: hypothetical protein [unclassified Streptomyces]|uniref:hypothetical protein n=1 Tax=Streptomyces sp. 900116325 TaxID=3154295 RepID=UPI0033E7D148